MSDDVGMADVMHDAEPPTPLDAGELYAEAMASAGLSEAAVAARFAEDLAVDVAPTGVDVTAWAFIDEDARGQAWMRSRSSGVVCGVGLLPGGLGGFAGLSLDLFARDGDRIVPGQAVARLSGSLRELLLFERTALNLVTHLSGIATLTAAFVEQTRGTSARVCDTRKTLPGLRRLQKYAVRCGGGTPHRDGLGDAMLVKDNHLAGVPLDRLAATLDEAAARARAAFPALKFVEVEVDTLEQLREVLRTTVDLVLLDNMSPAELAAAVRLRDATNRSIGLEASGGVTLSTIRAISLSGVDRVSVGALTHSAPSLDLGLDRGLDRGVALAER